MKKIGMVGGLSWQSTVDYYRIVNEESNNRLGNKSTVESIIYSTDLERKYNLVTSGQLDTLAQEFIEIAQSLEKAGADVVIMCTNTMHTVFDQIQAEINIPMIHIVDATAQAIKKAGKSKVALLGTTFTMTQPLVCPLPLIGYICAASVGSAVLPASPSTSPLGSSPLRSR